MTVDRCCWAAVAVVIERLALPEVTVSVDGSLYRFHPHFHDLMNKKISQLIHPDRKVSVRFIHPEKKVSAQFLHPYL